MHTRTHTQHMHTHACTHALTHSLTHTQKLSPGFRTYLGGFSRGRSSRTAARRLKRLLTTTTATTTTHPLIEQATTSTRVETHAKTIRNIKNIKQLKNEKNCKNGTNCASESDKCHSSNSGKKSPKRLSLKCESKSTKRKISACLGPKTPPALDCSAKKRTR